MLAGWLAAALNPHAVVPTQLQTGFGVVAALPRYHNLASRRFRTCCVWRSGCSAVEREQHTAMDISKLQERCEQAGQVHLLADWGKLAPQEQEQLALDLQVRLQHTLLLLLNRPMVNIP